VQNREVINLGNGGKMKILNQIGQIILLIAVIMLFQKYPIIGSILLIYWLSKKFTKKKKKTNHMFQKEISNISNSLNIISQTLMNLTNSISEIFLSGNQDVNNNLFLESNNIENIITK